MWIVAKRNMLINQEHVAEGATVEVDNDTGKYLVGIGKAKETQKPEAKKPEPAKQS